MRSTRTESGQAAGVLAVEAGENRDDHAARGIRVRGELVLARAVHEILVDHIVDGGCVPCVAGNVCKSGLTGVGVERILRGFARRNDRDRRAFAARGARFAARSLADLADTEMVAAAFSCEKGEFMSREPFEGFSRGHGRMLLLAAFQAGAGIGRAAAGGTV